VSITEFKLRNQKQDTILNTCGGTLELELVQGLRGRAKGGLQGRPGTLMSIKKPTSLEKMPV
jgi:hypothetical protein